MENTGIQGIMDVVKDNDVKVGNLLIKVYDTDKNIEGWITASDLFCLFLKTMRPQP